MSSPIERLLPWVVRLLWVVVLVIGGAALDGALRDAGEPSASTVRWAAFAVWGAGVAAMAVPSVATLTATRILVPTAIPAAIVAWIGGADAVDSTAFLAVALVTAIATFSSDLGRSFVQASAYGDEDRHLLRAPQAFLLVAVLAWFVWVTVGTVAAVGAARGSWIVSVIATALALAGGAVGVPRWHRLARRWLVLVPAGIVIHDHLVLAETVMLRRQEIAGIGLAPADTEAADLTGPAAGHAVEIRTNEPVTVLLGITPDRPAGTAVHLTACLVAPSRPGRALAAAASRRLPVGALA